MNLSAIDKYELDTLSIDKDLKKKEYYLNNRAKILKRINKIRMASSIAPYFAAGFISSAIMSQEGISPIINNEIEQAQNVSTSTFSDGTSSKKKSYDESYENMIVYYKPWEQSESGKYEREVIEFRPESLSNEDMSKYLTYSYSELEELQLISKRTIVKSELSEEDQKYVNPLVEIVVSEEDEKNLRKEDASNDLLFVELFIYIMNTFIIGTACYNIFIKRPDEYLENKEKEIKELDEAKIKSLRKKIDLRKQNISLFNEGDE